MTYTIKMKDYRPAGDWLIIAEDENGNTFHGNFSTEPTDEDVQKVIEEKASNLLLSKQLEEEEAAKLAEELSEEE
tara:strand:- start:925 stop:1149 length:225 start_codon:yes stop_codon:yes gene_type:complete